MKSEGKFLSQKREATYKKVSWNKESNNKESSVKQQLHKYELTDNGVLKDDKGEIVNFDAKPKKTLQINQKYEEQKPNSAKWQLQGKDQSKVQKIVNPLQVAGLYDPSISSNNRRDKMKNFSFRFAEKGFYQKNEELTQKITNAKLLGLDFKQSKLNQQEEKYVLELNADIIKQVNNNQAPQLNLKPIVIPDIEWWDQPLAINTKSFMSSDILSSIKSYNEEEIKINPTQINKKEITNLVQHPIPIKNEFVEKQKKIELSNSLTKKERKKLVKFRKLKLNEELREMQHLGLRKPPEPRLTYKNYIRVLSNKAVSDPTKAEEMVRKAYVERHNKMVLDNEARKLNKKQRSEKNKKKYERDIKKQCKLNLYQIKGELTKKEQFRIKKNARQLYLTGLHISLNNVHMLYVEGGPIATNRFHNLLCRRIKWEPINDAIKSCKLVWEGISKSRMFKKWKGIDNKSESEVRHFLADKGLEAFWTESKYFKDE